MTIALRTAVFALAMLQLGASTLLPAVDAVLEAEPLTAPIHVESPGNEDCASHHDHLFCQVVRSLSAEARAASPVMMPAAACPFLVMGLDGHGVDAAHGAFLPGAAHPRAPPLA